MPKEITFPHSFAIGSRRIGDGSPSYIIAEAGSNHNGDLDRALRLIDFAADAGADSVKFQLFSADRIAAATQHPIANIDFAGAKSLHELYRKNETPAEWMPKLQEHAKRRGICFLCTPFDEASADLLQEVDVEAFKIASFELLHLPLLRHIARMGKPILLSTGMAKIGEIEEALDAIASTRRVPVAIFHCGISYPMPFGEVNLRAMRTIKETFGVPVGYSDHTEGIAVPVATAALGGELLEKHFTESRSLPGPDHAFAVEPDELRAMVTGMRQAEAALGSAAKQPADTELEHLRRGRRSLFAGVDIPAGTVLTREMIAVLRPGVGLPPRDFERIVGRKIRRDLAKHEPILWEDI